MTFLSCLKSDFYKQKRSLIWLLHIGLSLGILFLFLSYILLAKRQTITYLELYVQLLGFCFPIVIGCVCAMVVQQEKEAGKFYGMLSLTPKRIYTFVSKLAFLLILEFISILLAVMPLFYFYKGMKLNVLLGICITYFLSNIFLYIEHLMISFRLGVGMGTFVGIVESLISALFLTGLGDGIWYVIPCSYSARMGVYMLNIYQEKENLPLFVLEIKKGLCIGSILLMILAVISIIWYNNWQGNQSVE